MRNINQLVLCHTKILGRLPLKGHTHHRQGSSSILTFCCDIALGYLAIGT